MATVRLFLWYDHHATEAAELYESIFTGSSDVHIDRSGAQISLTVGGTEMLLFDGGPVPFSFNEAISLFVLCRDQPEVDRYWDAFLAAGGTEGHCGWLKDPFGVSWQIVPEALGTLLGDPDPRRAQAAMQAMLQMRKLVVVDLEAAANAAG